MALCLLTVDMPEEAKPIYFKREELVGKSVVAPDASIVGTVEDLVATSEGKMGLRIARKNATEDASKVISSDEIQAMGDVILLKQSRDNILVPHLPAPPPSPGSFMISRNCSRCGYSNSSNSRFCIKCGQKIE